jgi:uncharacterized membrane protein
MKHWLPHVSAWRREDLRATLWVVPTAQVLLATVLFVVTYSIDKAAYRGAITLPGWVDNGSADAARQVLTAIAAGVITVVGLVFSITIVALTLASTQYGPRILRNFIRDRGTQATLGTFVATFVFAILALGSIGHGSHGDFVPHLSITVALSLVLASLGVLIYFIHHIAKSIQASQIIASIAADFSESIRAEIGEGREPGAAPLEPILMMDGDGAPVRAAASGYLQYIAYDTVVAIAEQADAVVQLMRRPGDFIVEGLPLATVWPASAAPLVARRLEHAHATGKNRTMTQDLAFAIDQLVEIAIRALSPAVNDTFTALTCIDWLSDGLCRISALWAPEPVHRDRAGNVRVLPAEARYGSFVDRAFDKIRQAGRGMPAVMIRQLAALMTVAHHTTNSEQRAVLMAQADMILRAGEESVPAAPDRADVQRAYDELVAVTSRLDRVNAPRVIVP